MPPQNRSVGKQPNAEVQLGARIIQNKLSTSEHNIAVKKLQNIGRDTAMMNRVQQNITVPNISNHQWHSSTHAHAEIGAKMQI